MVDLISLSRSLARSSFFLSLSLTHSLRVGERKRKRAVGGDREGGREGEREREKERKRERETHTHTDRQRDTQTDRERK